MLRRLRIIVKGLSIITVRVSALEQSYSTMSVARRVAVCQMTSVHDKKVNLAVVTDLVQQAVNDNVQMIFFPEACDYVAENRADLLAQAEPIVGGQCVNTYRKLARDNNVWLSMGGLHEKDVCNPTKIYNTHVIINNQGDLVQAYRKLHLFDVEIPERSVRLKESDTTQAGSHVVTPVATPVGLVGLEICYDMRFPELSTQLAMMGAEILTFPSAFTYATGEAHWEVLLRARAIENQCYVVSAAQSGQHNDKRRSYGRAMCVGPWGDVLADCGMDTPAYRVAVINDEHLKEVRRSMPVFQHRRKNVYSLYGLSLRNHPLPEHVESMSPASPTSPTSPGSSASQADVPRCPMNVFGHVRVPETCVFYRSEATYAFVNLRCVIPGHVLVAPIRLAERNQDLTEDEATDFYRTIRLVQKLMESVHHTHSCTVTIQDGADAGQTVRHLHCHIMPRKKGDFIENDHIYLELAKNDQLTAGHPSKPARTLQEMEEEAQMLRQKLKELFSVESDSRSTDTDASKPGQSI